MIRGKMMSCLSVTGTFVPDYELIIYLSILFVKSFFKLFLIFFAVYLNKANFAMPSAIFAIFSS